VALDALIDGIFNTFGYQVQIFFNESQDFEQVQALIADNVAEVKAVYPAVSVPLRVEGYVNPETGQSSPDALGFDTQSDSIRLNLDAGTAWQEDPDRQGVVLSSNLARQLEKGAGDRFVFSAGGRTFEREVIGITSLALDFVFLSYHQLDNADASVDEVDGVIEKIKEVLLAEGITAGFLNWKFFSNFIAQMMLAFSGIFIAAALVTAAVGAVGLLATLSMAVFERQKEIGVMRSIGASSGTIAGQFLTEGNLIGLLAWIVGVPLSFLAAAGLGAMFPFEVERSGVPPVVLVIGLVGMIVIATISSLWPSIGAARKTVAQIIRYQ
jgi:ABC-type lipoprotein release transport system permease subunit